MRNASFSLLVAALLCNVALAAAAQRKVEVTNNHSFPIEMPWRLGDGTDVMVKVAAYGRQTIEPGSPQQQDEQDRLVIEPVDRGVRIRSDGRDLGTLSWDLVLKKLEKTPTDAQAAQTKQGFDATFVPLGLNFAQAQPKGLVRRSEARAAKDQIEVQVSLAVYPSGCVDVTTRLVNNSGIRDKVYCAVLLRWQQLNVASRTVSYNSAIAPLGDGGATPFRGGEGRHHFIQRGVDWINTTFDGGPSVAMLHDFAPSFTVHRDATPKTPARWVGANTAQLAQEAIASADALYSITEIARPNIKMYRPRLRDNTLPGPDQPLEWTSRLIISDEKLSDERVEQLFIAYAGYNEQKSEDGATKLSFGVPFTKFGTAYFPYSTLGENFEKWHMPGQSKETYWPLSADTVTQWKLFADDIRRDLRIAKSMGFESIRLHHLELIGVLPKEVQHEYLDFFFAELRHLGLTALLDVELPPERVAELVKRYREQIDGVEMDNEVLIFGIDDEDIERWKQTYGLVKQVAPDLPVWLTGHTNTGAFERLRKLEVPFDKVGAHAYMDSLDAIPSGRGYALAVADYASEIGKPPIITEWNWRFLTRMTPEARAEIYPPIFENVLKTRCMPIIYQFQLQESLAMASKTLRGIRHYEQLNLSRRPRPEAFEMRRLIDRYGDPNGAVCRLSTIGVEEHFIATFEDGLARGKFYLSNESTDHKSLTLTARLEGPPGVQLALDDANEAVITLAGGETRSIRFTAKLPGGALPGFYHVFLRLGSADGFLRYAWAELRNPGAPRLDKDQGVHPQVSYGNGALDYDFNRDLAVVYAAGRENESRWDVESAWLIYQTLESATGRPVKIFQLNHLPPELRKSGNLIVVGMPGDHELIKSVRGEVEAIGNSWVARAKPTQSHGDWLIVAGESEAALNLAAIDLVLRYWKHAKDSGARRVPLTDAPINKVADPSLLP